MPIFTDIIIASWAVFILYWIVSAFGVKRDLKNNLWWRFAWLRIVVIAVIFSVLWETSSLGKLRDHWFIFQTTAANTPLAPLGALLSVLGVAFAVWARVHLGRNWSPSPNIKEEHELVTSGPYAYVRHPIYTGIIVAALGTAFVIPLWIILFFIITAMFVWRVKVEEAIMTKLFPTQYPAYKKRTWALIPFVW